MNTLQLLPILMLITACGDKTEEDSAVEETSEEVLDTSTETE